MKANAWKNLEEKLNQSEDEQKAEAWNPENPGDNLLGVVVNIDRNAPGSHGRCDVAQIETRDGETRALWISNTVLKRRWEEHDPQPGDLIGVKYEGKRESSTTGREYKLFSLVVEKSEDRPEAKKKAS